MSLKFQTRDPSLKSLPEEMCLGFLRPENSSSISAGFEPANFVSRGDLPRGVLSEGLLYKFFKSILFSSFLAT